MVEFSYWECYSLFTMKKIQGTTVYFIATKIKQNPAVVNFYTETGKQVQSREVKKIETRAGTQFYIPSVAN